MKRQIVIILIVCLLNLMFVGCGEQNTPTSNSLESSELSTGSLTQLQADQEYSNNQSISVYLPDDTYIEAVKTKVATDAVEFRYTATYPDQTSIVRNVRIEKNLRSIQIKDIDGNVIAGYSFNDLGEDEIGLTVNCKYGNVGIATGNVDSSPVRLSVYDGSEYQVVEFDDYDQVLNALDIYEEVETGYRTVEDLSGIEANLYDGIEDFVAWSNVVQSGENSLDINTVVELTSIPAVNDWLGDIGNGAEEPILEMPLMLDIFCKIVKIIKKICHIGWDGSETCEWIDVIDDICELIREFMK